MAHNELPIRRLYKEIGLPVPVVKGKTIIDLLNIQNRSPEQERGLQILIRHYRDMYGVVIKQE